MLPHETRLNSHEGRRAPTVGPEPLMSYTLDP